MLGEISQNLTCSNDFINIWLLLLVEKKKGEEKKKALLRYSTEVGRVNNKQLAHVRAFRLIGLIWLEQ